MSEMGLNHKRMIRRAFNLFKEEYHIVYDDHGALRSSKSRENWYYAKKVRNGRWLWYPDLVVENDEGEREFIEVETDSNGIKEKIDKFVFIYKESKDSNYNEYGILQAKHLYIFTKNISERTVNKMVDYWNKTGLPPEVLLYIYDVEWKDWEYTLASDDFFFYDDSNPED